MLRFLLLLVSLNWLLIRVASAQTADSTARLTVGQMQRDINVLQASLTSLHPGLYRYNTAEQIQQHLTQLRREANRPLPLSTFYLRLAQFTAKLRCGHTYPNPFNLPPILRGQLFADHVLPLYFRVCQDQWVITHNLSASTQLQTGDQITAINDIPVDWIRDSLLTVSRSDGQHNQAKRRDNLNLTPVSGSTYSLFDQYFPLFFPASQANFKLTIQPHRGAAFSVVVPSLSKAQRQHKFEQRWGILPIQQATWQYRSLDKQTAYLKIGDLAVWGWAFDAGKYLDSVFTAIQQAHYTRLIVDIRGCEGGDDEVRNELLSYLMPHPFGCHNPTRRLYQYLTVADSLLPYLQTWDPSFKQPKPVEQYQLTPSGLYEKKSDQADGCQSIPIKAKRFQGQLTVLIDATNSSTTFTMAHWVQQAKAGQLVGEPTGGTKQGLNGGQFFFLHLPASQIEIDIPLIYQAPTAAQPDEGVQPDHLVRLHRQDIAQHKDVILEQALRLMRIPHK